MQPTTNSEYGIPAIICDAGVLAQIATIQELGKCGIPVIAIADTNTAAGFASRFINLKLISHAKSHENRYIDFLIRRLPRGVIFYSNDGNIENISRNRQRLVSEGFKVMTCDHDTLCKLTDKGRLFSTAAECGVKVPRTDTFVSLEDLGEKSAAIGFPVILKATNLSGGIYKIAETSDSLPYIFEIMKDAVRDKKWKHRGADLILQKWIPQKNIQLWNFNACVEKGEILAYSMGKRIRTNINPDGNLGSSLLFGETEFHPAVFADNKKILAHTDYSGIVEMEWSFSPDNGDIYLYDFNARPSGNIRWVFKSGVSLAECYYRSCLGLPPLAGKGMQEGVRYYKILWNETDFLEALKNPHFSLQDRIDIFRENLDALCRFHRHAIDVFDPADPFPTLKAAGNLPFLLLKETLKCIFPSLSKVKHLKKDFFRLRH